MQATLTEKGKENPKTETVNDQGRYFDEVPAPYFFSIRSLPTHSQRKCDPLCVLRSIIMFLNGDYAAVHDKSLKDIATGQLCTYVDLYSTYYLQSKG